MMILLKLVNGWLTVKVLIVIGLSICPITDCPIKVSDYNLRLHDRKLIRGKYMAF